MMVAAPELPSPGESGWKRKDTGGLKFTGPHYQKLPRPVVDTSAVDAKRGAEDSANVTWQLFSALPFTTGVDCVFRTNIAFH